MLMERKRKNERGSKPDTETCFKPRVHSFSLPIFTLEPVVETVTSPTGALASIPFHWEEAPGKPRRASNTRKSPGEATNCATKSLKLPPRLLGYDKFSSAPSSNPKILDNTLLPYVDVSVSRSSLFARDGRRRQWAFGALCCNKISEEHKQRRQFGSWGGSNHHHEDCFDQHISSEIGGVGDPIINTNVMKIKKSRMALSLSNLSPHFMASMYASLRQVVPWSRKKSF